MQFNENPAIDVAVEAIMRKTQGMSRGDVLRWSVMEAIIGESRGGGIWTSVKRKIARRLRAERGIAVWALGPAGWTLLRVGEQIAIPGEKRRKRAFGQTSKAVAEIAAVPLDGLATSRARLRAVHLARFVADRQVLRASLKQARAAIGRREPLPRRAAMAASDAE